MNFGKLNAKELTEFLTLNQQKLSDNLVTQAVNFYIEKSKVGFLGLILTAPVLALDRSIRFPWKSDPPLTKEYILETITEEQVKGIAGFYHVDLQTPNLRQVIYKIMDLQGNIIKPIKFKTVWNIASGMGKTEFIHKLAYQYANSGHNCLCVDLDPNCGLTKLFYGNTLDYIYENFETIVEVSKIDTNKINIDIPEFETDTGKIYAIPGDINLLDLDIENCQLTTDINYFRDILEPIAKKKGCDIILLDILSTSAHISRISLMCCNDIMLIVKPTFYGVQSIKSMTKRLPEYKYSDWYNNKNETNISKILINYSDTFTHKNQLNDALRSEGEFNQAMINAGYSVKPIETFNLVKEKKDQFNNSPIKPVSKPVINNSELGLKNVDPFDTVKYANEYAMFGQWYDGPELYFLTANYLIYKYGELNERDRDILDNAINSAPNKKEYLEKIMAIINMETLLLYWYAHFKPAKANLEFVRNLMIRYQQAEDILVNRLYKRYINSNYDAYAHQLWIKDPPCCRPKN